MIIGALVLPRLSLAATSAEIQAQINAIMQQIQALQQQITQLQAQQGTTAVWCHDFSVNLKIGDKGNEVSLLRAALAKEGFEVFNPQENPYESSFDEDLASAVTGFQQKYASEILTPLGLKYGTGFVGKATRAKLNKLYGCGIQPPVCIQVITPAQNPQTGECKNFPTPCDVPVGWQKVSQCVPVACTVPACQIGYTLYDTGEKDSNGCPIKRCIPPTQNQPPVISGVSGPTTLKVNEIGTWTVKASDPEQGILTYSVIWGDEGAFIGSTSTLVPTIYVQTATFTHSYSKAGIYNPTFTVGDDKGLSARTSISVNVGEAPISCTDSDSGKNYYVKGTVTKGNVSYTDECAYCTGLLPSPVTCGAVKEYYCENNEIKSEEHVCGSGSTCSNGACISTVIPSSVSVLSPNGGESWGLGSTQNITWTSAGTVTFNNVKIGLYQGGSFLQNIIAETANDGSFSWTVPANLAESGDYKIRINKYSDATLYDESNANFSITAIPQSVTVSAPNGGETWPTGTTQNIIWTSAGTKTFAYVKIDLYKAGYFSQTIKAQAANDGLFSWLIPVTLTAGSDYKIRISKYGDLAVYDGSDAAFSIVAATACVPEGGSLGAVYPGNTLQCCAGLVPYIPPGIVGTRGTCQKSSITVLSPSGQYSASILENMKITLDQIQKVINDWQR